MKFGPFLTIVTTTIFWDPASSFHLLVTRAKPCGTTIPTTNGIVRYLSQLDDSQPCVIPRAKTWGELFIERSDTFRAAGFYDLVEEINQDHTLITTSEPWFQRPLSQRNPNVPLYSGIKTTVMLFLFALGLKWYRAVFVNKLAIWERQPAWNTVITSKEDEEKANLQAMTCNNCGSTLFIAKGRKWFQFPKDYECYACGAKGEENFTNTRKEITDSVEDDTFEYENPLALISKKDRKQLMKLAGGDEKKAVDLLTQRNNSDSSKDAEDSTNSKSTSTEEMATESESKKTTKKEKKSKTIKVTKESNDDLDLLGMDE